MNTQTWRCALVRHVSTTEGKGRSSALPHHREGAIDPVLPRLNHIAFPVTVRHRARRCAASGAVLAAAALAGGQAPPGRWLLRVIYSACRLSVDLEANAVRSLAGRGARGHPHMHSDRQKREAGARWGRGGNSFR